MKTDGEPRPIDLETWPRREAFDLFRSFDLPYWSLTADVDVTRLRRIRKGERGSFTVGLVHAIASGANAVPAFRQRIRGDGVVEFDVVHPSITIQVDEERFAFCTLWYDEDFERFAAAATERIEEARRVQSLWMEPDRDDFLFMTAIPWVSFTGLVHPLPGDAGGSVPRLAWGRFREVGDRVVLPLNVQAHHALVDGIHVGRFFEIVQTALDTGGLGAQLA